MGGENNRDGASLSQIPRAHKAQLHSLGETKPLNRGMSAGLCAAVRLSPWRLPFFPVGFKRNNAAKSFLRLGHSRQVDLNRRGELNVLVFGQRNPFRFFRLDDVTPARRRRWLDNFWRGLSEEPHINRSA